MGKQQFARKEYMIKKEVDKGIKYKGKSQKVKDLVKKLNLGGGIQVKPGNGWFERAMENLDKKDK